SRTDFQYTLMAFQREHLQHDRGHVGLGDGLFIPDRQRPVIIRVLAYGVWHEPFARYVAHRFQHTGVHNPARLKMLFHHRGADLLPVGNGHTGHRTYLTLQRRGAVGASFWGWGCGYWTRMLAARFSISSRISALRWSSQMRRSFSSKLCLRI